MLQREHVITPIGGDTGAVVVHRDEQGPERVLRQGHLDDPVTTRGLDRVVDKIADHGNPIPGVLTCCGNRAVAPHIEANPGFAGLRALGDEQRRDFDVLKSGG